MSKTQTKAVPACIPDAVMGQFDDLLPACNAGDQQAAKALAALCREHPEVWRRLGDLQAQSEDAWLRLFVPGTTERDAFNRETMDQGMQRRRQALTKDGDSPLEMVLIDRIVSAWLQMQYADLKQIQALDDPQCSFERAEFNAKRVDRAQRQLLRAVQALATVRRLVAPTQVNIGQNQINVAGQP